MTILDPPDIQDESDERNCAQKRNRSVQARHHQVRGRPGIRGDLQAQLWTHLLQIDQLGRGETGQQNFGSFKFSAIFGLFKAGRLLADSTISFLTWTRQVINGRFFQTFFGFVIFNNLFFRTFFEAIVSEQRIAGWRTVFRIGIFQFRIFRFPFPFWIVVVGFESLQLGFAFQSKIEVQFKLLENFLKTNWIKPLIFRVLETRLSS